MSKFTFTSSFVPDQLDRVNDAVKISHEFEAESLDVIVGQFSSFLKGCGFEFDHIEVVADYEKYGKEPVDKDDL